ncbi:MAG: bifunctional demethylmenaquinone methyltransferase/2-methoxy-6-polyprenyl-1,4-benzoquinol methylase UbiE [candidate division KSB1 bacterium]|nr:bifunctional demethylmenaquinone methyltransferase/2-methoxy-6-polyprenyl-1,4-benzoquinol methylase UbiE [candidate division KSB1 bacterium]
MRQKRWSSRLFDRIAGRYDLLNRVLSLRLDVCWRRTMLSLLPVGPASIVIDLATGTGDVALEFLKKSDQGFVLGVDPSRQMLAVAKAKAQNRDLPLRLVSGDAMHLSIRDCSVDAVTIAFGIRNFAAVSDALREVYRILKPNGRLFILEFSMPQNRFIRVPYLFYLRHLLPRIGAALSGDRQAYRYLNVTIEDFSRSENLLRRLRQAGFSNTSCRPLTFGIAALYTATKES